MSEKEVIAEKQFEDNLRKLIKLMDDPQEGIRTWHQMRLALAKKIFQFLWNMGYRSDDT